MRTHILAGSMVLSALAGFLSEVSPARAASNDQEKVCQAVFEKNQATIERLAAAGDKAGIQAIFSKAGCSGVVVSPLPKPAANAKITIHCKISLGKPVTIDCGVTIGK